MLRRPLESAIYALIFQCGQHEPADQPGVLVSFGGVNVAANLAGMKRPVSLEGTLAGNEDQIPMATK